MRRSRQAAALWLGLFWVGCSPYSAIHDPLPPTTEMPETWTTGGETAESGTPDQWWAVFDDAELTRTVEIAVTENYQIRAAWARLRQTDTLGTQASSQWWPQVSAQINASRRRSNFVFGASLSRVMTTPDPSDPTMMTAPTNSQGVITVENDLFEISLPVSYELDLWDRIGSQVRAASFDMMAARDNMEALAMTVAANTVEAWLNVIYQRQLRSLIEGQVSTSEAYVEILQLQFTEGLGTALSLYQQQAQLQALRAQLATTVAQERVAEQQLAVLLGHMPGSAEIVPADRVAIPELPPQPSLGVPADLLIRRPDIRAARHAIEAADQRVAAAIAQQLPTLNLSASLGFSSPSLTDIFERFVFSLLGSLAGAIFDGGRRDAVTQQNHAIVWERTETLAQTMLTAAQEVEASLVQEEQQLRSIESLEARLTASRAALREARSRYAAGLLEGYLEVLTALSTVQAVEQAVLASRRQLLSYRVQLHRALGGGWTRQLEMPEPNRPVAHETESE